MKFERLFILLLVGLSGCNNDHLGKEIETVLGVKEVSVKSEFTSTETLTFAGEGYSIQVLMLSNETIREFESHGAKFEYPVAKSNYAVQGWKKGPIPKQLSEVIDLVLNYWVSDDEIRSYQHDMEITLLKDGSYYSYYYKTVSDNMVEIEFFLIDVEMKRLYIVRNEV